jgi:hypothetical protein
VQAFREQIGHQHQRRAAAERLRIDRQEHLRARQAADEGEHRDRPEASQRLQAPPLTGDAREVDGDGGQQRQQEGARRSSDSASSGVATIGNPKPKAPWTKAASSRIRAVGASGNASMSLSDRGPAGAVREPVEAAASTTALADRLGWSIMFLEASVIARCAALFQRHRSPSMAHQLLILGCKTMREGVVVSFPTPAISVILPV